MNISRKTDLILNAVSGEDIASADRTNRKCCPYRVYGTICGLSGQENPLPCKQKDGDYNECSAFKDEKKDHLAKTINSRPELFFMKEIAEKIEQLTFAINDLRMEIKEKR